MLTVSLAKLRSYLTEVSNNLAFARSYTGGDIRPEDADEYYTPKLSAELKAKLEKAEMLVDEVRRELFARQK